MRATRNFCQGVQARLPENSSDNIFFLSPQFILQFYNDLSMVYLTENYNFPRFQRGPTFSRGGGGGGGLGGGLNTYLYRNQLVIFQGGPDPLSPLLMGTCKSWVSSVTIDHYGPNFSVSLSTNQNRWRFGTRWNKNLCAKDAGCAGNKITVRQQDFAKQLFSDTKQWYDWSPFF